MRTIALAAALAVALAAAPAAEPVRGLTAAPQLVRAYDTIFDARFDEVAADLERACPPAPREVCRVLDAVALWWRIQLNPDDRSRDKEFLDLINYAIAGAETWTTRERDRAEAWFYLGGAYGARVQWRVLRGERLAAARDGKRIKDALDKALALDPTLHDAWFGIGLYHYYADVAPAAAKVLRWLLFLPGGDRVKGMQEMLHARDDGTLLRSEADYQLQVLYLWYEDDPDQALQLLEGLRDRHASNPHFLQLIAEVQDVYKHDLTASLRAWRALYDAARRGKVELPQLAETRARLGMALQLDRLYETDSAIEHLRDVIAADPEEPFGAMAQANFQLGAALNRLGQYDEAASAYRAAAALADGDQPPGIADQARAALRQRPDPAVTAAYRLSLQGWRALERGDLTAADRAIDESLALQPRDPVTRYRQAKLLQAQRQPAEALTLFEAIAASRGGTPPTFFASACVEAARLHEQRGERARAVELYRIARGVFGADQRTKDAAQRALARLTPPPPPRSE